MKYFLIAGEASGDLHGAHLIQAIKKHDHQAQFQFLGGDMMERAAGVAPIIHYRDMAYMRSVEVAKHLPGILGFMRTARAAIDRWHPDRVVLIDYPSFNLKLAKHAHEHGIAVHYFISPKVWVWKEWRVKDIKRYVDQMYCILPFEPDWYAQRDYRATYVGNPTVQEISEALAVMPSRESFCAEHGLDPDRPIIALVPGSRVKEIRDNMPSMLEAARRHADCQLAIAVAPNIDTALYGRYGAGGVTLVTGQTWQLVRHARVAIVTSGKYVTLPNLIADEPVIPELLMHLCTPDTIDRHLSALLNDGAERRAQLDGYTRMMYRLGTGSCTDNAAHLITNTQT